MTTSLIERGMSLLRKIESLGDYRAYIVGGTPRDMLIGKESEDVDIATNCPMEVLERELITFNIGKSKDFGILVILHENTPFEVAQFRSDGEYSDGRRPDSISIVRDFRSDAARRDFTINSMGMDSDGGIIDHYGGIADLEAQTIRTVGDPLARFKEDYVRMMRAARFAAAEGFIIEKSTRRAIRRLFRLVRKVTPERIRGEIIKAAKKSGPEFANFIMILDDLKLLYQILPEVASMKYFNHDMVHHPEGLSVFTHSIECLKTMGGEAPPISKIAALLHDIGKPVSFQEDRYGWKMSYHRHERKSAQLAEEICHRLRFSSFETEAIVFAVKNHMKFHGLLEMKPSKISRLADSQHFNTLVDVAKADEFSRGETFMYRGEFDKVLERVEEIKERWKSRIVNHSTKLVDGNRIMKITGLDPGRIVGNIKRAVEDRIMDEQLDPDDLELIDKIILEEGKIVLGRRGGGK
jgi:tRNA nucleotidyltransferase/poly(A) polymerase